MGDPGLHGLRLEAKVQLLGQVVGEVGDHVLCREPPAQLGQFDGLREALEDLQVGGNAAADARPLDLDHHLLAAAQGRVVHLGDGRRRERLFLEGGEQPGRLVAEFLDEELVHLVGFCGRHPVEQAAEFPRQRLTECSRAGRDDLAELHVCRSQIGEGLRELLDHLLLPGPFSGEPADEPDGGAGDLPTGGRHPGSFDRQRYPVKLGHLAVCGGTHLSSVPNRGRQLPIDVSPLTCWVSVAECVMRAEIRPDFRPHYTFGDGWTTSSRTGIPTRRTAPTCAGSSPMAVSK
ncbi:hypothetical protein MRGA327_04055 [Mycobacterium tuberculosis RGTB327]|nr:hypothetical protein MRGA327_04055 [Mycobacterium tuberculosis RGTB327]